MTVPAVAIHGLTKKFDGILAVDGLSLTIEPGEMFCLVGPDGAGKTTTIRMLCGIIRPTSGGAKVFGNDVVEDNEIVKRQIGYFSQRFTLYGDLTVDENIEFFAEIHDVPAYEERREELLEFTRLTAYRKRLAEKLSGGMKQKLALACTLVHTPKVIFLDEPTTGVDVVSRRDFWKILSSLLRTGITIVTTTPYLDEAERASRVGLIDQGRLVVVDTPPNIKGLMRGTVVEIVCDDIRAAFAKLKRIPGIQEVQLFGDRLNIVLMNGQEALARVENELREAGIAVRDRRTIPPSLENVFISVTRASGGGST